MHVYTFCLLTALEESISLIGKDSLNFPVLAYFGILQLLMLPCFIKHPRKLGLKGATLLCQFSLSGFIFPGVDGDVEQKPVVPFSMSLSVIPSGRVAQSLFQSIRSQSFGNAVGLILVKRV